MIETNNTVNRSTVPGDVVIRTVAPAMTGEFVRWVDDDMFIVNIGGMKVGAHKDFWKVVESSRQKPNVRREEELAGFVKNIKTGDYQQMFITQIGSPMLCRNRAIEKAKGYNEYIGEEYDLNDVVVKRRVFETIMYPWEKVEEDE